ncbi:MAG TPA: hypothetical protein VHV30_05775 [Polyangiaceae bacterium]|jgi:hypothetical protein|nr:hypothetical protein [Polyangiaceae bacterium]
MASNLGRALISSRLSATAGLLAWAAGSVIAPAGCGGGLAADTGQRDAGAPDEASIDPGGSSARGGAGSKTRADAGASDDGDASEDGEASGDDGPSGDDGTSEAGADDASPLDAATNPAVAQACPTMAGESLNAALSGEWLQECFGVTCNWTIDPSGQAWQACSDGEHYAGTVDENGSVSEWGGGGSVNPGTVLGSLILTDCNTLSWAFESVIVNDDINGTRNGVCAVSRVLDAGVPDASAPDASSEDVGLIAACNASAGDTSLLDALEGQWLEECGGDSCIWTLDATGYADQVCTDGEHVEGCIDEGGFVRLSGGGGPDASEAATGTITLTSCSAFRWTVLGAASSDAAAADPCTANRIALDGG